jgi:acetyl esterase/lipase
VVSLVKHNRDLASNLLGEAFSEQDRERVSSELHVTDEHPPTFLFHTTDDPVVPAEQSIEYARALMAAGVSVELHLYASGPHGVGLAQHRPTLRSWPRLTVDWLAGLEG